MAIIYSYPLVSSLDSSNLFPLTATNEDDELYVANVTFSTLASEIIDEAFNGTDRYIPRFDGTSSLVNSVIYEDSNSNIGIGTTSPSELLHIEGTLPEVLIKGTGNYDSSVITMSNGSGDSSFITNYNNPGVQGLWLKYDNGNTGDATIKVGQNELLFDVNNGTAMYINSSRNVGINATNLYSKLHIGNSSNSNNNLLTMESSGYVWVHLKTPSNNQSQIGFGDTQFVGQNTRGRIVYNSSTTTANNYMSFVTNFAEIMRITNSNVGIGTTSPASKLEVDGGDIEIDDSASGLILRSPNGTRYRVQVDNSGNLTTTAI